MRSTLGQVIRPELTLRLTGLQILTNRFLTEPLAKLEEEIEDALAENPCLERLDAPATHSDDIRSDLGAPVNGPSEPEPFADRAPDDPDMGFHQYEERTPVSTEEREPLLLENFARAETSLADHLLEQLRHAPARDLGTAAEAVIWSLDENGYLRADLAEIAAVAKTSPAVAERALALVQSFDPIGVAARDPRECLLLQLRADPRPDPVALGIVDHHFDALGRHRHDHLARVLQLSTDRILVAVEAIRHLDPKPGRAFGPADARPVRPEAAVEKINGEYVVTLNDHGLPVLGVARGYRRLWGRLSREERRFVSDRRQAARWIVEAIEQRRRTLRLVVEAVVRFQRDFFDHGPAYLKPLIQRQVADEVMVHESTVSRATSCKYIDTPHGVFPLKHFFQPGIPAANGHLVATRAVKEDLRALIAAEDPAHPCSDLALASALRRRGFAVARRTVAKYRDELAIPACQRRTGHRPGAWQPRTYWESNSGDGGS